MHTEVDDEIMLDLRDNREELGYSAVKSDYNYDDPERPEGLTT